MKVTGAPIEVATDLLNRGLLNAMWAPDGVVRFPEGALAANEYAHDFDAVPVFDRETRWFHGEHRMCGRFPCKSCDEL